MVNEVAFNKLIFYENVFSLSCFDFTIFLLTAYSNSEA